MRRVFLIIFFVIGSICCGPTHFQYTRHHPASRLSRSIPIYMDYRFGNEDQLRIDEAIQRWNYVLNGWIVLDVIKLDSKFGLEEKMRIYNENGLMIRRTNSSYQSIPKSKEPLTTIAWTNKISGNEIFLVRDRLSSEDVFFVTLHELGHYLGAEHDQSDSLMNPIYTRQNYQCIDLNTIKQISIRHHLNYHDLNYCVECYY